MSVHAGRGTRRRLVFELTPTGTAELRNRRGETLWASDADEDFIEQAGDDFVEDVGDTLNYLIRAGWVDDWEADHCEVVTPWDDDDPDENDENDEGEEEVSE